MFSLTSLARRPVVVRFFTTASTPLSAAASPAAAKAVEVTAVVPSLKAGTWTPQSRRTGAVAVKVGMLPQWDQFGYCHGCTVLALLNCQVTQVKTEENEGFTSLQVGNGRANMKKITKPMIGHYEKAGVDPKRVLHEFRVSPDAVLPVGTQITARHFVPGQYLDVTGWTSGKGFQGAMKRWGFAGLVASHGVSVSHRSHGSTGQRTEPARVFKGKKMAGHMGTERQTVSNLWLFKVDVKRNLLLVKGDVPGHAGNYVLVKDAAKKPFTSPPPFPTFISTGSEAESQIEVLEAAPRDANPEIADAAEEAALAAEHQADKKGSKGKKK